MRLDIDFECLFFFFFFFETKERGDLNSLREW